MKKRNIFSVIILSVVVAMTACSEWTGIENLPVDVPGKSDGYYANLKAYKSSDHPKAFGWFAGWVGSGASLKYSLAGVPDSMDMVSIWGNWGNITPVTKEMRNDLKYTQQVKGIKVYGTVIVLWIGDYITPEAYNDRGEKCAEYWGFADGSEESINRAIRRYAEVLCDSIVSIGFDGLDVDWEPYGSGQIGTINTGDCSDNSRIAYFLECCREFLDVHGKELIVDGEIISIPPRCIPMIDCFIYQAYGRSASSCNSYLASCIEAYAEHTTPEEFSSRFIVAENFEAYAQSGGGRLLDQAAWIPTYNGQILPKGGCGTYHMEYEFTVPGMDGTYPQMRKAIQIMNPSVY